MPAQKLLPAPKYDPVIETVRFYFPQTHELALYALATLQSYVEHFYLTAERVNLWNQKPEKRAKLQVLVYCNQRFYMTFRESFPDCVVFIPDFLPNTAFDELSIDLTEPRLMQFPPERSYSIQWVMAMLAGTRAQILPHLKTPYAMSLSFAVVWGAWGIKMEGKARYVDGQIQAQNVNLDFLLQIASELSLLIAPQGILTVLAAALGKPVLEVTETTASRALLGLKNYVQVSEMQPRHFFINTVERGVSWLRQKIQSQSVAAVVQDLSPLPPSLLGAPPLSASFVAESKPASPSHV